jgi:murein DD-endopeptidase MepM/ murein hydrolase activator NlpD
MLHPPSTGPRKRRFYQTPVFKTFGFLLLMTIVAGYLLPQRELRPPLLIKQYRIDPASFWYYPWGESLVHKGIDIFAKRGTEVTAPTAGIVLKTGYGSVAGNYVYLLGAKWKIYYFAHLESTSVHLLTVVSAGDVLGKIGTTGNAANKPAHVHFSIFTPFPEFRYYDSDDVSGWKKMFYLNPLKQIKFPEQNIKTYDDLNLN